MAASDVEICNSALHKIGASRITSLSDSSKAAIICNDQYNRLRKEVLRAHPWNFAIKFISLAATSNTPIWDAYTTEFLLPSDVLRVLETDISDDLDWEIGDNTDGNKVIFANVSSMKIKYITDVTNTTRYDACFDEALAFRIAADLAYSLINSAAQQANMYKLYQEAIKQARSFDAQEKGQDFVVAEQLTDIRR